MCSLICFKVNTRSIPSLTLQKLLETAVLQAPHVIQSWCLQLYNQGIRLTSEVFIRPLRAWLQLAANPPSSLYTRAFFLPTLRGNTNSYTPRKEPAASPLTLTIFLQSHTFHLSSGLEKKDQEKGRWWVDTISFCQVKKGYYREVRGKK